MRYTHIIYVILIICKEDVLLITPVLLVAVIVVFVAGVVIGCGFDGEFGVVIVTIGGALDVVTVAGLLSND